MLALYAIGGLLLAVMAGLVAVGLWLGEEEEGLGEVSEGYRRENGWVRR